MRGKLLFVTGAAVGYVLGARAGRKRYEQIISAANKVWESPGIQKQVTAVEDFVAAKVGDVPGLVYEGAKKLVAQATARQHESRTVVAAESASVAKKPAAARKPAGTTKPAAARKPAGTTKPASKQDADDAGA